MLSKVKRTAWTYIISSLFLLFFLGLSQANSKSALLLEIKGPIGPATQDYIERGIRQAEKQEAGTVILMIDTPGGLETSMRGINKAILSSKVPVVGYVSPAGARAASAGAFILYASHIAAMAPGTNLGVASPVEIGEVPSPNNSDKTTEKSSDILAKKATHDAVASIRSLAEIHKRNADWGERAVREAVSLSAEEALKLKVIDVIAYSLPER